MDPEAIVAIVFTFSSAVAIVYIVMSSRHRERMAMIQRGMDPGAGATPDPYRQLLRGMQFIAVAVGLGLGYLLKKYTGLESSWVYLGPVIFCVGVAMLLFHFRAGKRN
ncbi:MAG: hypothetical protein J5I62_14325 [Flavobacteriales bacterium]|nr:hypothetical protein [Flavobacteriales bacterium]MEB2341470.1 hypothetical protein [Flavobacteriia bacterium]